MMPIDSNELLKARDRLLSGDVVAIPTETVYGLAASIDSESGLRKVFSLKERPFFDPLIVHVASFKEAASVVREWPPLADYLARYFWPGPLTLVLPKAEKINPLITSGLDTVAVRYPAHPVAQDLIRLTGTPLAAPSANKFGRTSPSTAAHVRGEFPNEGLIIIDGGECEVGLESTVLAFEKSADAANEDILILRPGGVTTEMLKEALEKWSRPVTIRRATSEASPGHLKHHYMPKIPLVIVSDRECVEGKPKPGLTLETRETSTELSPEAQKRIEALLKLPSPLQKPRELALSADAAMAARELYKDMRRLSETGADLLFIRATPDCQDGLWQAIWDRITRAASLDLSNG